MSPDGRLVSYDGTIWWDNCLEPGVCTFCDHYIFIHAQGRCRGCDCERSDCLEVTGRCPDD